MVWNFVCMHNVIIRLLFGQENFHSILKLPWFFRLSSFLRLSSFWGRPHFWDRLHICVRLHLLVHIHLEVVFSIYTMSRSNLLFTLSKSDLKPLGWKIWSVAQLSQAFLVVWCMLISTYNFKAKFQLPTLSRSTLIWDLKNRNALTN